MRPSTLGLIALGIAALVEAVTLAAGVHGNPAGLLVVLVAVAFGAWLVLLVVAALVKYLRTP